MTKAPESTISIVTPWLDHPELIPEYAAAVAGAEQVIIVDNASRAETAGQLERLATTYLRNESNRYFAPANNQGLAAATGDIVLFLNNDISAPAGWLDRVRREVQPGVLYGPSLKYQRIDGELLPYLEGWCIGARRDTWLALGGWDAEHYPRPYWEDNDLCYRAVKAGLQLAQVPWPLLHLGNTTGRTYGPAYADAERNRQMFIALVRAGRPA